MTKLPARFSGAGVCFSFPPPLSSNFHAHLCTSLRALDKEEPPVEAGEGQQMRHAGMTEPDGPSPLPDFSSEPPGKAGVWLGPDIFLSSPRRDTSGAPWGGWLSSWAPAFSCWWPTGTASQGESARTALIQELGALWWRSVGRAWV